jgi:ATP-dependent Lhr-like helicase
MSGDIEIPDHPLVREVMRDTLSEAMDIDGLLDILRAIDTGTIRCIAIDTPVPSLFAHELIHAMPYSYLDEADALARRARAASTRRTLPDAVTEGAGKLDPAAIDTVRQQLWPDVRDEHELHDLLLQLVVLPLPYLDNTQQTSAKHWPLFFARLAAQGRAHLIELADTPAWIATERLPEAALLWPEASLPEHTATEPAKPSILAGTEERPAQAISPRDAATTTLTQGWLQLLGPTTSAHLAHLTHLQPSAIFQSLLTMEMQGLAMRGVI